jgi:uncharacterized delta-60 repeat protein
MKTSISQPLSRFIFLCFWCLALVLTTSARPCHATPGALDLTWDSDGKVTTDLRAVGSRDFGRAMAVQPDGKVVVAGYTYTGDPYNSSEVDIAVVRYNSDGSLDTSFNGTGKVITPIGSSYDAANAVALDGAHIIVAGTTSNGSDDDIAVVRYNSDGSLDTSFNGTGKVITPIGSSSDGANAVALDGSDIIVAGYTSNGNNNDIAVVRYNSDGGLDTSFNGTGKVTTPIGSSSDVANAVALDGAHIIVAGTTSNGSDSDIAVVRYNSDGSLDTSFNGTGKVTTPIGSSYDVATAVALDGSDIIVAGYTYGGSDNDIAVVRYNSDGSLDTSFNGTGKVTTPIGWSDNQANSMALDGSDIIVAGTTYGGRDNDIVVVRYNSDGSLDTSFNGAGKVAANFSRLPSDDTGRAMAVQPDGKVIVAGTTDNGSNNDFAVVRYNSDGSLDTSFSGTGKIITPIGPSHDVAYAVALDGSDIIVAGYTFGDADEVDIAVVRYNSDGSLDTSFNGTGKVITSIGSSKDDAAYAVAVDGAHIIVAGTTSNGSDDDIAVVRYNSDGSLDTSFNGTGKVITPIGSSYDAANAVALDGAHIIVAGYTYNRDTYNGNNTDIAVVRYNSDGSLDTSFNGTGKVVTSIGSSKDDVAYAVAVDGGHVVVAGYTDNGSDSDIAVVRYNSDGSLDTSFNGTGKVTTPIGSSTDRAYAVALDGSDIIVAGYSDNGGTTDFAVVRYEGADNTAPTISDITGQGTNEDTATGAIAVTVGDAETAAGRLVVSATSSNTSLVPNNNIAVAGSAASRTLTITPAAEQSGTTTITVTVSDGTLTATDSFVLTVNSVNDAPTLDPISDPAAIDEDAARQTVNLTGITPGPANESSQTLSITATSNNTALIPDPIVGALTGTSSSLSYTPVANAFGNAHITVQVQDNGGTDSGGVDTITRSFTVVVNSVNDLPTISDVIDQSIAHDSNTGALSFTVGDTETAVAGLSMSGSSSNTTLVPNANIVFGGSDATRTVTVTPAAGQSGTATITLTVTDGDGGTAQDTFVMTVIASPVIGGFSPTSGGVGTLVTISGSNLANTSEVKFNGVASTSVTQVSNAQVRATVPSGATTGPISLTTPGGTSTSSSNFTFVPAPVVGSFSPLSGGYGTVVTISGNNLGGATLVKFHNFSQSAITHVSAFQIKAAVPAGATSGPITLTTPGGSSTSAGSFTVFPPPSIGSFSPAAGNIGSTVSISGSHLSGATLVKFHNTGTLNFTVLNNNLIHAVVPANATTGKISATTPGGTADSSTNFTVILQPRIASFSPATGAPGTLVTLSGNNLSGASVAFNGTPATSVTQVSSFQVRAVVPVGATSGKITATTDGGTGASTTDFIVLQGPSISSFTPGSRPIGTGVVISGSNFSGVTAVRFNGAAATFVVDNAGQITTVVPSGATTGRISVTTNAGTGASSATFTVTAGTAAPVITGFTPATGAQGTTVFITGSGFVGATSVKFNGVSAPFIVTNALKIQATVPANATDGQITVTTAGGTATSPTYFVLIKTPVINSFTPSSGPAGTSVTLNSANFTGTTNVKFNGVTAGYTIISATQIKSNVPAGATTGKINVTNGFGTEQSSTDFLVSPRIDSFSPTSGPVGTLVTITGKAFSGATAVQFNGTLAEFTVVSATQITATVPDGATSGVISVTTPSGVGNSSANFTVTP